MASALLVKLRYIWWWCCVVAKLGFASALVIGILVAYGLRFSVTSAGPFTLGLYGESDDFLAGFRAQDVPLNRLRQQA